MSPNKLIVPYLHRVCRHLLWPPYRARIRRELTDHILSRAEELRCRGSLTQEQAVRQVLRALGDPDVLGKALRQARLAACTGSVQCDFRHCVDRDSALCVISDNLPAVSSTKAFCIRFTERSVCSKPIYPIAR